MTPLKKTSFYGSAREAILVSAMQVFEKVGYSDATVASICQTAGVSNGSFFHFFGSKRGLAAQLYLNAIGSYHKAMLASLDDKPSAELGVTRLVTAHLNWVVECRGQAKFIFEQSQAEWLIDLRKEQTKENTAFLKGVSTWFDPLVQSGTLRDLPLAVFNCQIIGPAQIFCRAWLSGRGSKDPREQADQLSECAVRSLVYTGAKTS